MENLDVAKIFGDVADLLEIQGANPFRVRAYRTAARNVETMTVQVASLLRSDERALEKLPGIGKDLAGKIKEIVETGKLPLLEELTQQIPETLVALVHVPGVGPRRAKQIYDALAVKTLDDLEAAARAGRLRGLRGLGSAIEERILRGVREQKAHVRRWKLAEADAYTRPFVEYLRAVRGIEAIDVAGSARRRCETVGDVDILVAAKKGDVVADRFVCYPDVKQVLARGPTKCSVVLRSGLQVDLRIVPALSYGAALYYFTGSKAHNIAVRTIALRRKLKVNEYGVFRGTRRVAGRTEPDVFKAVGLPWIPPELRENRGEVEAARDGKLPKLVTLDDIRGDLQMHSTDSDGKDTLAAMMEACRARGYAYAAITDHSPALRMVRGLTASDYRRQFREIEKIQAGLRGFVILKSAEVDILEDGTLDLDDAMLAEFDVVVASVHSKFNLPAAEMTRRVTRALRHPSVNILAHPTGRKIGRREPYPIDMEEVVKVAKNEGVLLEVNAQTDRLDLNDRHIRLAREAGVKLVVSTDAHRIGELDNMRYGVEQARRGWCEARDIANTYPLELFRKTIRRK